MVKINLSKINFLALAVFLFVFLLLPLSSFADGIVQTGPTCWPPVAWTTEEPGPEISCPYAKDLGSTLVTIEWKLNNRGGIPNPMCFVTCVGSKPGCKGGNYNDGGILKGEITKFNLGLEEKVIMKSPVTDTRYQVICCERDMDSTSVIPECKGEKRISSKKFWVYESNGWGSCNVRPQTIYLTQPTKIGRVIVSITTAVKESFAIGADPVGCAQGFTEKLCSHTLDQLGTGGQFLSRQVVGNVGDLVTRMLADRFSFFEGWAIRTGCKTAGGGMKFFEQYVTRTSTLDQ